jgi:hypothetical protein
MTRVCNFVADLLRGGTSVKEAKKLADCSFRDKLLKMRAIFNILKQIKEGKSADDRRKSNKKKRSALPLSSLLSPPTLRLIAEFASRPLPQPMVRLLVPFSPSFTKILGW